MICPQFAKCLQGIKYEYRKDEAQKTKGKKGKKGKKGSRRRRTGKRLQSPKRTPMNKTAAKR